MIQNENHDNIINERLLMHKNILIINIGGTFNKYYDPIRGELCIDNGAHALEDLASKWKHSFKIVNIIGKDSIEMTSEDRLELLATIHQSSYRKILIVHGTDTMDLTAAYLSDADLEKCIILTGSMVPYSIDPVEATANFAFAYGSLLNHKTNGVFIAMHGLIDTHDKLYKERKEGRFKHRM